MLVVEFVVCPNPQCQRFTLTEALFGAKFVNNEFKPGALLEKWRLIPNSTARPYPDYIPEQLRKNYEEACKIRDLSPKASATLCRRCLQGMIRDFWGISKYSLKDEIEALYDKLDSETWNAIDALRKVGNIGAHMERDVNLVVDVDPDEAERLVGLIETLFEEWYVSRHDRQERMKALASIAENKTDAKKVIPPEAEISSEAEASSG